MVIKFNRIKLYNFCSYEDTELNLADKGFCLVSGRNKFIKDNALSNGSGKSTIWSAICFALTGETINGVKSNIKNINSDSNTGYVKLEFLVDKDSYIVTRYFSPRSDLKITKNDIDISGKGIRESEKTLGENLPDLTKDLIATTIILGQGMPHKFSSFSPSGRKDLLEKLTKSDFMIDDIKSRIETRQVALNQQLRELEDSLLVNNTQLNSATNILNQLEYERDHKVKVDYTSQINDFEAKEKNLRSYLNNFNTTVAALEAENDKINSDIITYTTQRSELLDQEMANYMAAVNSASSDKSNTNLKIESLNNEIKKIKSIKDVCPTCGQKIPGVIKPCTDAQELEVANLKEILVKQNNRLAEIDATHKAYIASINAEYTKINELQTTLNNNKNQLIKIKNNISVTSGELEIISQNLIKLRYDRDNSNKVFETLLHNIEVQQDSIRQLNSLIGIAATAKEDVNAHIAVVKKIDSIVKRDFRGYLLYNILEYLNNKAKEYSEIVFDTNDLDICLNGNAIDISYCNKPYESLSGGEKQRVDIIIQFAIRDLLQVYFNYSSNILVLDEITDNLDRTATERIFDLIITRLNDVESIFIISHHDEELGIPVDSEIRVTKDENSISTIKEIN